MTAHVAAELAPGTLAAEIARSWVDHSPKQTDIEILAYALVLHGDRHGRWVDRGQARAEALAMIVGSLAGGRGGTIGGDAVEVGPGNLSHPTAPDRVSLAVTEGAAASPWAPQAPAASCARQPNKIAPAASNSTPSRSSELSAP